MHKLVRRLARPLTFAALAGLIGFGITCIYPPSRAAAVAPDVRTTKGTVDQHHGMRFRCSVRWVQVAGPRDPIRFVEVRGTRTGHEAQTTLTITTTPIGTAGSKTSTVTVDAGDDFRGRFAGNGNTLTRDDRAVTCHVVSTRGTAGLGTRRHYWSTVNVPKR